MTALPVGVAEISEDIVWASSEPGLFASENFSRTKSESFRQTPSLASGMGEV